MVAITLPDLFHDASHGSGSFRKNMAALRKVHLHSGKDSAAAASQEQRLDLFHQDFFLCLCHLLPVRKGNVYAERTLKFLAAYLEALGTGAEEGTEARALQEQLSSQLVEYLLAQLEGGLRAANKVVRYRVCQLISILLNHLAEIEDELFCRVREGLLERIRDKEATVRLHASTALSRLQECGDKVDNVRITQALLDLLHHDPSADVRKNAMWNLDVNKRTTPALLSKARDVDAGVRKLLYAKLAEDIPDLSALSLEQRDTLLHAGLSDRDAGVRKACLKLLCDKWIPAVGDDMIALLTKLDVYAGKSSEPVLKAFFSAHPELEFPYDARAWASMSAQIAFLLRTYCAHCVERQLAARLEDTLPTLSEHVEFLESYCQRMLHAETEEAHTASEFVLGQLLLMADYQDLSDELGRRRLLTSCRTLLVTTDLSTELIASVIRIICKTADNEEDYMRMMVELLHDIADALQGEAGDAAAEDPEVQMEHAISLLKCLDIIKCVLQNSQQNLKENVAIYGLLERFVIPSIQSSNSALQTEGLVCLGLCCIMDVTLAQNNVALFMQGFASTEPDVVVAVLQIVLDLLTMYGLDCFDSTPKAIFLGLLKNALESDVDDILAIAVEGTARLLLLDRVEEPTLLQSLLILYYHPSTASMAKVQQCLSYFFQAFAYSVPRHQQLVQGVFVSTLKVLLDVLHSSGPEEQMLAPLSIAQQLVDWTDVRRLLPAQAQGGDEGKDIAAAADDAGSGPWHAEVAVDLMGAALKEGTPPAHRKVYVQVLAKLPITQLTPEQYAKIMMLSGQLLVAITGDAVTTNALKRFTKRLMDCKPEEKDAEERGDGEGTEEHASPKGLGLGITEPPTPAASEA